jgi:hypothetical protein
VFLLGPFWSGVAEALLEAVQQAVSRGGTVRDSLAYNFPRLLALVETSLEKCVRESELPGAPAAVAPLHKAQMTRALQILQDAFLSASLARMQQAVGAVYASGHRIAPSAVSQCVRCACGQVEYMPVSFGL